ncbi:MAG: AAA family ATPase, partial [Acidobacteria bacterium]|nr:AAA family ATPase [Acidobacteriota bacterium]
GKAYLSAILCKACWVALKGDVLGIIVAKPPGRVQVRSRSQTGHLVHQTELLDDCAYLPRGEVTYHLGLLALAEALAHPLQYSDLLDALDETLEYRQARGAGFVPEDAGFLRLLGHLSDELYFALRYGPHPPEEEFDRLAALRILEIVAPHVASPDREIDPRALIDSGVLRVARGLVPPVTAVEPPASAEPGTVFRGWQLKELVETLNLGMNAMLIGPTATGKSLAVGEARERLKEKKPFFVIEGHESLKEFDLLGGYVPVGPQTYEWRDGVVVQAMKAGGLLFCDEANRMPTRTLNVLLGILSRRSVVLTEHGSEEVPAAEGFQIVLAMNLGRGYAVNTLDAALVNRFDVTLEFRYLPPDQETELLVDLTALERDIARIMVKVANETRQKRRNKELAAELTPRGLIAWARKYQEKAAHDGKDLKSTLKTAAKVTWIPSVAGTDADGYVRDEVVAELLVLIESHTPRR